MADPLHVLVTGGAGFIGSHLVDLLLERPDRRVTVLDRLSRGGSLANLEAHARDPRLRFVRGDVDDARLVGPLVAEVDAVAAQRFGDLPEGEVELPGVVRRARGEGADHRSQRGHAARREDPPRVLREAAALGVVEGREQRALPAEHEPRRVPHRVPHRRAGRHAPCVELVGRGRDQVVGLARAEPPVVRGEGPRGDGLGAERLGRPALAGLGAEHARHVRLERELVDDDQVDALPEHLEGRRVLAPVDAQPALAAQPEPRRAPAVDLDPAARHDRADRRRPPPRARTGLAGRQRDDLEVGAADLHRARPLHHRHPDRPRGRGGHGQSPGDRQHERGQVPHRRPMSHRISVRTTLSRSEVASGK